MKSIHFCLTETPCSIQRGHLNLGGSNASGESLSVNSFFLERNGQPWLPIMGEFQYSRYPREEWETELLKLKAGGVQMVGTYLFWIHHEEEEGVFLWTDRYDLRYFVELCSMHELEVCLRIGPFVHGEARNGGLPDWLFGQPFEVRSNDPRYLAYVARFYKEIGQQVAGLMFKDNGPVVAIQFENEFMDSAAPWETTQLPSLEFTPKGSGGVEHMLHLKRLALEAGLEVPLNTATGWGSAPILEKEFLPLFGGYAFHAWAVPPQKPTDLYLFTDRHARKDVRFDPSRVPFASCEMGGGMQVFYKNRPIVPPASVEAMHVTFMGKSTNLVGYYVYHGGSNPVGKLSYLNEHRCPRISYDFQAPIREFGQLAESYHRLRRQFLFLETWGSLLAPMRTVLSTNENATSPTDTTTLRGAVRHSNGSGFVFLNNYQDHLELPPRGPFLIQLQLPNEEIIFPREADLRLEADVAMVIPFHLNLDGIDLRYATAQPLTRIEHEGTFYYFFFVPQSGRAEFAFAGSDVKEITVPEGRITRSADNIIVSIEPDQNHPIKLEGVDGRTRWITTMTNVQSLHFWKGRLAGAERVIISDVDLLFRDDKLELLPHHETAVSIRIFPPFPGAVQGPLGICPAKPEGLFNRYDLSFPPAEIRCEIRQVTPSCAVVRVEANAFAQTDELLLRIQCVGDVGTAYINGKLIHDHFCNGLPWELGLRRFLTKESVQEITLKVSPKHTSVDGPKIVAGAMANLEMVGEQVPAEITSVVAIARRRFSVEIACKS